MRGPWRLAVLTTALLTAASALAAPRSVPAYAEIKDWMAACDNTRFCRAMGLPDIAPGPAMVIGRQAGPAGALDLAIIWESRLDPAAFALDGKPLEARIEWSRRPDERGAALVASGKAAADFIRTIRNGSTLSFGPAAPPLSLSGMAAALLLMDDVQGRVGGETALARPGPGPAAQVPPEPPLPPRPVAAPPALAPHATKTLIASLRAARKDVMAAAECEPEEDLVTPHDGDRAMALSRNEALALLECFRGPYQSAAIAFRVPVDKPDQATRLTLPLPLQAAPVDSFFSADFDPARQTLSMKANGRGLGDCGQSASWVFNGRDFQLAAYARQGRCGGITDWPVLWRTGARP